MWDIFFVGELLLVDAGGAKFTLWENNIRGVPLEGPSLRRPPSDWRVLSFLFGPSDDKSAGWCCTPQTCSCWLSYACLRAERRNSSDRHPRIIGHICGYDPEAPDMGPGRGPYSNSWQLVTWWRSVQHLPHAGVRGLIQATTKTRTQLSMPAVP